MTATKLYTPEVLGLATGLAEFAWDEDLPLQAEARSRSCGSSIALGLELDAAGKVERVGMKSHACAVGQAAAAIFAKAATGRTLDEIGAAAGEIEAWLARESELPGWPGLAAIAPALDYPARHPAIMLAWNAARHLLPSR